MKKWLDLFLISFVSLISVAFFPLLSYSAIIPLGSNNYQAGFSDYYVEGMAKPETIGRQQQPHWCWAASVQVSLNLLGIPVSQRQVVFSQFRSLVDYPANIPIVLKALSGWKWDFRRKPISVLPHIEQNWNQVLADLRDNHPVILDLSELQGIDHAVVLTGATYSFQGNSIIIKSLIIRDPWPTAQNRRELPFNQLEGYIRNAIGINFFAPYGF